MFNQRTNPAFKTMKKMIADGKNGLVINRDSESIYKAVKQLLDDAQLLKKLGEEPALNFVTKQETIEEIEDTLN